jgi:hypothetical protein
MMLNVPRGLVVVACVSVGYVVSAGPGLLARAAEPDRWVAAIEADASSTVAGDGAAQRMAELEQRVKELEAERGLSQRHSGKSPELSAVVARNEELVAKNLALSVENRALSQSRAFEQSARTAAACEPPNDADPKAQIRYWGKLIRDSETAFGSLSPEWNAALSVLLRRERELDPNNPWLER